MIDTVYTGFLMWVAFIFLVITAWGTVKALDAWWDWYRWERTKHEYSRTMDTQPDGEEEEEGMMVDGVWWSKKQLDALEKNPFEEGYDGNSTTQQ